MEQTSQAFKIDDENIWTDDEASIAAQNSFGIKYMYPWQRLVVANIMDAFNYREESDNDSRGKQIVLLPTGAGKSLCFQVPALLLPGPTLVIYPLLALMSDQERRMVAGSLECVVFRGGLTENEKNENFLKIKNGAKIIIANPEVLGANDCALAKRLKEFNICHIAIDEAHCVSEWGDSFRPSYLEMGKVIKEIGSPVVTAFTATASPEVLERVAQVLFDNQAHIVRSDSDRPNIHYYVRNAPSKKKAVLILCKTEAKPMIVFCGTRSRTEDLSREINLLYGPDSSRFYHAGLSREEKSNIEQWFFNQKEGVLCATCAYGMGVDKKDIHTVVHLDPPLTAEAYIQEAGRGGRDGSVANGILLWNNSDTKRFSQYKDNSRKAALRLFATTTDCRRQVLLDALGAEKAYCDGCDLCDSRRRKEAAVKKINETFGLSNSFLSILTKNRICSSLTIKAAKAVSAFLIKIAEKLYDKGILHFKFEEQLIQPGEKLFDPEEQALKAIKKARRFYTSESLEEKLLPVLNEESRKFTKANIWEHHSFCELFESLQNSGKIRILRFPWKGRIDIAKNHDSCSPADSEAEEASLAAFPSAET